MPQLCEPLTAWTSEARTIPEEAAAAIVKAGWIGVAPIDPPNEWLLAPGSKVGVLVGDGWELHVRPRLNIPQLLFLLAYSTDPGWRTDAAHFGKEDELMDAIASGFAHLAMDTLRSGLLHGYVSRDEAERTVRGRIRFGDQIARSAGIPLPIEVTYDDFTANVIENRMLLTAAELLLMRRLIPASARRTLLHVRGVLDDVEPLQVWTGLRMPEFTRLNEHYRSALTLAKLVLDAASITAHYGQVRSVDFVFDMNRVFQQFLEAALREAMRKHGGELRRESRGWLDQSAGGSKRHLELKPDISWWRSGALRAIVDAKYKSLVDKKTMPNADAYQMLAYCIGFGLPRGFLVYAKEAEEPLGTSRVVRHGYEITVRSVDLERAPVAVLAQVHELAEEIAGEASDAKLAA
jgi:5-methylcytosine-specific restriction enzyme subunit McrC